MGASIVSGIHSIKDAHGTCRPDEMPPPMRFPRTYSSNHSPTGSHSFQVFLNDSCCVVASNTWTAEVAALELEADREWLVANSVVKVSEPMWVAAAPDATPIN